MNMLKKDNNVHWGGFGEKTNLTYYWWDYKMVQPLWRKV